MKRSPALVGILALVFVTVLWFQFVYRHHSESPAGADTVVTVLPVVPSSAADPTVVAPAADPAAPEAPVAPAVGIGPPTLPTGLDAAIVLRIVQDRASAAGVVIESLGPAA